MSATGLRIDKWLWYARFFKTRSLATKVCLAGKLRLAGTVVAKAHHPVHPGDVLSFAQGRHVRVVRVVALGDRRGPAAEAQRLYQDLKPPTAHSRLPPNPARGPGSGRPTKRERRDLERLRETE